ncbi:hypothetical protein MesoLjLc_03630 [Mesorhizobium sp. L-8-10]|uniref:bestrophin-like domain n=1 Tax=Mesorhizobium sp. L-8-10 TaxID=2744523 RepID=UPI001927A908|nr:hypothetical protein [Mesorhizobium sp. L-8-10]BCH28433.1 hypothetical protein MesoLjLc_03630 [Mesorhizobium sp. L-8-10]
MAFFIFIAERSLLAFGLLLFLAQLIAHEIGLRFGRRDRAKDRGQPETVGIVVGGMLGLLAFVLALTLSFANTRFNERREGSLMEANAIGTAWLRAKAIGGPQADQIAALLEQYTQVRADFVRHGGSRASIAELNQRTNALQSEMWGQLAPIVREQPSAISNSLMLALNDLFDASTKERLAFETRLPPQLFWLLIGMTLLSVTCLGYQFGLKEKPSRVLVALLTLMWTAVIVDILDLAASRIGQLRTATTVYEWTLQGFGGTTSIPSPSGTRP